MKILHKESVYDATLERLRYLFDEFERVVVAYSGGKDSTVIFNLAMKVAKEKNRLPLTVFFLDQEAEWTYTIDLVKKIMYDKDVNPLWLQVPLQIENSATFGAVYQNCWGIGEEWLREKDPLSKKENIYGWKEWADSKIGGMVADVEFPNESVAWLTGVRGEESPKRMLAITSPLAYKHITWGSKLGKAPNHIQFHPIYDWSYTDVWKSIHDNDWEYNKIYDFQYRHGVPITNMRVSNLHHETAVKSLFYLQEADKDLYNRMTKRMGGIDTAGKMGMAHFFPKKLPSMFKDWTEYRDYLAEKLITDEALKEKIAFVSKKWDEIFDFTQDFMSKDRASKVIITSIITGDVHGNKMANFQDTFVSMYIKDKNLIQFTNKFKKLV